MALDKQPVPHAGGKITISPDEGGFYQLRLEMNSGHGGGMYQVAMSRQGTPLAVVPASGLGQSRPYPQPSVLAFVMSDTDTLWGRRCSVCKSYFRTDHTYGFTTCPYCTFEADSLWFLTEHQLDYLRKFVEAANRAINEQIEVVINFDDVTDAAEWTYDERKLQHKFLCKACGVSVDILGEYGSCPKCGKRNSGGVFNRKLNDIDLGIAEADQNRRADLLNNAVAVFEAMANDFKKIMLAMPSHPNRKKQIEKVNFQDIISSSQQLTNWFAFELDAGVKNEDLTFVNLMFKRRHLFVHNAGRVDQKYLDETGDHTFELNEMVVVGADELKRLVPLVRMLGSNLINGIDNIA
jgi:hypothetical protein